MKKMLIVSILSFVLIFANILFAQEDIIAAARQNNFDTVRKMLQENKNLIDSKDNRNCTILHYAANGGAPEMVEWLIKEGAITDVRDVDGDTPLHWAVYVGRDEIVNILISHGLDKNAKNNSDQSVLDYALMRRHKTTADLLVQKGVKLPEPGREAEILLHRSASLGSLELVNSLMAKGVDTHSRMPNGSTFLHSAAEGGIIPVVSKLLKNDTDIFLKDGNGYTPLHYAAKGGALETVKLLRTKGIPVDITDDHERTPLHKAAQAGKLDVVKYFVENGANINKYDQWNQTPLVMSTFSRRVDLFKYLLDHGAKPVLKREHVAQPIHRAVQTGSDEIIKLLLSMHVPVNVPDDVGASPMEWAVLNGNLPVLDMLLSHLNGQKIANKHGSTLLHIAAYHGKKDVADYLIDHEYSVQDTDSDGRNALHWAVYGNQENMVEYFMERNMAINKTDSQGRTPLHIAAIRGNIPVIETLSNHKADLNLKDSSGSTPLDLALKYGRMDAANALRHKGATEANKDHEMFPYKLLKKPLEANEAIIWYLGHSGYAVKTKNHFLIFDYMGKRQMPAHPGLANGAINPAEIENETVSVFVSHQHGDHYFRGILDWKNSIQNIQYFFGWKEFDTPGYHCFSDGRETKNINNLEVTNIFEQHDDVPESAFLVKADDVVIFHTGDYFGSFDTFKDDLKFLAKKYNRVDISFMFLAGETTVQSANIMKPKTAFPMHGFTLDYLYKNFPERIKKASPSTKTFCPEFEGDVFFFKTLKQKLETMKPKTIFSEMSLAAIIAFIRHAQQNDFPVLKGPYLGQKPPGMTPEVFAPDGKTLYFTSKRPAKQDNRPSKYGNIWATALTNSGWTEPRMLEYPVNTSGNHDCCGTLTNDGTLYFFSRREGGFGQSDIYRAQLKDGKYVELENLGKPINSEYSDYDSFIAPDESYLIFSSDRPGGYRQYNGIYIAFRKMDGTWAEPKNLGYEFRDSGINGVSLDNKFLFYTCGRTGKDDIYWVDAKIIDELKPKELEKRFLEGINEK